MPRRANGEGTIIRNAERGRWEGRITGPDGRRHKLVAKTRVELTARMTAALAAFQGGAQPARADYTVGAWLDHWLVHGLGPVGPATRGQYEDVVRLYIKPRLGRKRLATLTPSDVDRMIADMTKPALRRPRGYSPDARRLARSILRRALSRAMAEGLVSRNVAALSHAVKQDRTEARTLEPDQARALLAAAANQRLNAAVVLALTAGLRLSEVLGLTWDSVDLERGLVHVRNGLKRVPRRGLVHEGLKTNRSRRTVRLTPLAVDALKAHRSRQAAERLHAGTAWIEHPLGADLVFRGHAGGAIQPRALADAVSDTAIAAGLGHWKPHELRHSAASLLLAQGIDLVSVADFLGHSSATVTAAVYAHVLDRQREATAAAMAAALS